MPLDFGPPHGHDGLALDIARAQVLPITHERIDSLAVYLSNTTSVPVTVEVEVHELERIWDRAAGVKVAQATLTVPSGPAAWRQVELSAAVQPNRPHRVVLRPAPGVFWHFTTLEWAPVGTVVQYLHVCPGGPEPKNRHLACFAPQEVQIPAYEHWRQIRRRCLALRLTPQPHPFPASAVNNGRAWPEQMPNLWISDPRQDLPQWVELRFDEPVAVNTLLVSFDTQLDMTTDQRPALWRAPECVRDWRVHACVDGRWRVVFEQRDNYHRRCAARFDRVVTQALRLEVLATNADSPDDPRSRQARIYEIRVMNE
jgi:hypothetical protein